MHLPARSLLTIVLVALPLFVSAKEERTWDFKGKGPEGWEAPGLLSSQITDEGVSMQTGPDGGGLIMPQGSVPGMQAVTIRVRSLNTINGYFVWHVRGKPDAEAPQLPFTIRGSPAIQAISLPLTNYKEWNANTDFLGVGFAPHSDVLLQSITFTRWNATEQFMEFIKGFWTFDEFRPYSINFLWGPLVSYNPITRESLYATLPPVAPSATRGMYWLLGACLFFFLITLFLKSALRARAFGLLCAVFIGLWMIFDLRMGSELIVYAMRDLHGYVLAPTGQKKLRTHQEFYDVLHQALPYLKTQERFGLLTDEDGFYSLVRYEAYPSLPIVPSRDQTGLKLWLVSFRNDVSMDAEGRLVLGGKPISPPGRIIKELPRGSILFEANSANL